jgi:hypothetical protein
MLANGGRVQINPAKGDAIDSEDDIRKFHAVSLLLYVVRAIA